MATVNWLGSLPGHIQFGDFLFGPGSAVKWDVLEGWEETAATDSGTVLKSTAHGAWPGAILAQTRTVTVNVIVKSEPGQMNSAVRDLAHATPIDAEDEIPLVVQLDEGDPLVSFARCARRAVNVTRTNRVGLTRGSIQFVASDPRRYALAESQTTLVLPQSGDSLHFPLHFPLSWGAGSFTTFGNPQAFNFGDAVTNPTLDIYGPCSTPSITNVGTGEVLEYDITLGNNDVLHIDTAQGTVTLNGPSANRLYTATPRSVPEPLFVLKPGSTTLAFRSNDSEIDPNAHVVITWRSAFW